MIVPVLKYLDLDDIENKEDFSIAGCAYIGMKDEKEVNLFHFRVLTPNRLCTMLDENKIFDGRGTFIVKEFDRTIFKNEMNGILEDCIRSTWDEVLKAIDRFLEWDNENNQTMTLDEVMTNVEDNK